MSLSAFSSAFSAGSASHSHNEMGARLLPEPVLSRRLGVSAVNLVFSALAPRLRVSAVRLWPRYALSAAATAEAKRAQPSDSVRRRFRPDAVRL